MKRLIFIIVITISVIGFTLLIGKNKVKSDVKNNTALNIKYYDNARLYKLDIEKNKFYLIRDFKRKQIV